MQCFLPPPPPGSSPSLAMCPHINCLRSRFAFMNGMHPARGNLRFRTGCSNDHSGITTISPEKTQGHDWMMTGEFSQFRLTAANLRYGPPSIQVQCCRDGDDPFQRRVVPALYTWFWFRSQTANLRDINYATTTVLRGGRIKHSSKQRSTQHPLCTPRQQRFVTGRHPRNVPTTCDGSECLWGSGHPSLPNWQQDMLETRAAHIHLHPGPSQLK